MTGLMPTHDVDAARAQVGHRQRELSAQASAHRLARTATGDRRNHRLTALFIRSYLHLWWVLRPRGAQLGHILLTESVERTA
jgi:hypothetical protein